MAKLVNHFWRPAWGLSLFLSLFALVSACSSRDHRVTPSRVEDPDTVFTAFNPLYEELALTAIDAQLQTCQAPHCRPELFASVGLVFAVSAGDPASFFYDVRRCTGSLFHNQNIVALSSHCLNEHVLRNREHCGEYVGIQFPAVGDRPTEVRMCKEILFTSEIQEGHHQADYAFFRIDPIDRRPLPLHFSGVADGDKVMALKVDRHSDGRQNRYLLSTSECEVVQNTVLEPQFRGPLSPIGLAIEGDSAMRADDPAQKCKATLGNSGAPILNTKGEVVGYLQDRFVGMPKHVQQVRLETHRRGVPPNLRFAQLSCMIDPYGKSLGSRPCAPLAPSSLIAEASRQSLLEEWKKNIPPSLKHTIELGRDGIHRVEPECFELTSLQLGQYDRIGHTFPIAAYVETSVSVDSRWVITQQEARISFLETAQLMWNSDEQAALDQSPFRMVPSEGNGTLPLAEFHARPVPLCVTP